MINIKPEDKLNAPLELDSQLLILFEDLHKRIYKLELAVNDLQPRGPNPNPHMPNPRMPTTSSPRYSRRRAARPSRRGIPCQPNACAGSTSSTSTKHAVAMCRRLRAA